MSELSKNMDIKSAEAKWNQYWIENKVFASKPDDRPSYTIVMPPPNVTGVLHLGHALNNSLQDFFVRKARKEGYNALWVPGTDHASIATEAKVVQMLRQQGIKKSELSREEFLKYAFEWKEKYGGIIIQQLKAIGCSCDWDREEFTMNPDYYKAVVRVFVDLYKKGYIYKGKRIINWDCEAQTALSNEEVIYSETPEKSKLFHIKYRIADSDEFITIATTRPETIFGDVAIAINPKDERYQHLKGKYARVPLIDRKIPIIFDDYVDQEFGTGCLKVTPAHDVNDYEIGLRHQLPFIDILNDDGKLNEASEYTDFVGLDRFEVRKKIAPLLEAKGQLSKVEEIENKVGRSERTNTVVEPKLSEQWFIDMQKLSRKAHEVVMNDEVILYPHHFKNTYNHWMSNVKDWCISRQLWWGHRIPAYYLPNGEYVVAETIEEAYELAQKIDANISIEDLTQDEDVLDTWASSWLWPIEVFKGFSDESFDHHTGKINIEHNAELKYYLPTKILVTAPEILFFWVARMIIANYEYLNTKPFEKVFLTGIVRDKMGRKMSKSLGNSPDLFELIDKYGSDSVRFGLMSQTPAGNDIFFDEKCLEVGRNFANKIWNAFRLIKGWKVAEGDQADNHLILQWFEAKLQKTINSYMECIEQLRVSEGLKILYSFVWDDFCSWYLELIKPDYGQPIDATTYHRTISFLEQILSMLNPCMPIITEEIWHLIDSRTPDNHCSMAPHPQAKNYDQLILDRFDVFIDTIVKVREVRANLKLKNKDTIGLSIPTELWDTISIFESKIRKLVWTESIDTDIDGKNANSFMIGSMIGYVNCQQKVDDTAQRDKLLQDLKYYEGFVKSIEAKLSNEGFVSNAPEQVVSNERKKLSDGLQKIEAIKNQLLM